MLGVRFERKRERREEVKVFHFFSITFFRPVFYWIEKTRLVFPPSPSLSLPLSYPSSDARESLRAISEMGKARAKDRRQEICLFFFEEVEG